MGDVTLTVYEAGRGAGALFTANKTTATSANDYYFANNGQTLLVAESAAGSEITVEVVKLVDGLAVTDLALTATAGKVIVWGPFPPSIYNSGTGQGHITVDADTDVLMVSI